MLWIFSTKHNLFLIKYQLKLVGIKIMNVINALGGIKKAKVLLASWSVKPTNEEVSIAETKIKIGGLTFDKHSLREEIANYYFNLVGGKQMALAIVKEAETCADAKYCDTLTKVLVKRSANKNFVWCSKSRTWEEVQYLLEHNLVLISNLECAIQ